MSNGDFKISPATAWKGLLIIVPIVCGYAVLVYRVAQLESAIGILRTEIRESYERSDMALQWQKDIQRQIETLSKHLDDMDDAGSMYDYNSQARRRKAREALSK